MCGVAFSFPQAPHPALSTWFRDYLFYPVSRKAVPLGKKVRKRFGKAAGRLTPTVIALAVVWLSTGIWHGASWGYILWGIYYGILLISGLIFLPTSKKWVKQLHINTDSGWFVLFQTLRTMFLVLLGYVLFRSVTLGRAGAYFAALVRSVRQLCCGYCRCGSPEKSWFRTGDLRHWFHSFCRLASAETGSIGKLRDHEKYCLFVAVGIVCGLCSQFQL